MMCVHMCLAQGGKGKKGKKGKKKGKKEKKGKKKGKKGKGGDVRFTVLQAQTQYDWSQTMGICCVFTMCRMKMKALRWLPLTSYPP